jgi:hypothetical protein
MSKGRLKPTNIRWGSVHPSFFVSIIVILVADNPAIQIGGTGPPLRDFGVRIGWLELNGVGA